MNKIFLTGGTGSFGSNFIDLILKKKSTKKIVIFSRDELKQHLLKIKLKKHIKKLRFLIGDIRDFNRVQSAMADCNLVIHAAALKQVDTCELNPDECIKTNIIGSQNVIRAALHKKVSKSVLISTDKAVNPINLYGACKLSAEKLFISANLMKGKSSCKFSVVRYGNVLNSRGSVIPHFLKLKNNNSPLPITDKKMTRFFISLNDAIDFVYNSINLMKGGEIFVPKINSILITDIAKALNSNYKIIGIREGEKIHETLISTDEKRFTIEKKNHFLIITKKNNIKSNNLRSYNSRDNNFLKINEIKKIISKV